VVVDEAYQSTYSSVVCALSSTEVQTVFDDDGEEVEQKIDTSIDQVVLIGDPEQIGPVVLDRDNPLLSDGPFNVTDPAPNVFSMFPDTVRLSLPSSYRLGADTTSVVKKFYDFDFDSRRPDMSIDGLEEVNNRKSTRLNSSHVSISYAVFCLKKKKTMKGARDAAQKMKTATVTIREL